MKKYLYLGLFFGSLFLVGQVYAVSLDNSITLTPQVPIPGLSTITICEHGQCNGIATYITYGYKFLLGLSALLAVLMFVWGGIQWMMARSSSETTNSKKMMQNSIAGLMIGMSAYLLLWTINPDLVNLPTLGVGGIQKVEFDFDTDIGFESSEDVISGKTKGIECYLQNFGNSESAVRANLVPVTFQGFTFNVHRKMASSLQAAATQVANAGITYRITPAGGTGGFNWRPMATDKTNLSLHSFGMTIDINPPTNPLAKPHPVGSCVHDIPDQMIAIMKSNGFSWGGDWKSLCDAMHFEWHGPCAK